eukprot:2404719-Rhodomonas_salina.1
MSRDHILQSGPLRPLVVLLVVPGTTYRIAYCSQSTVECNILTNGDDRCVPSLVGRDCWLTLNRSRETGGINLTEFARALTLGVLVQVSTAICLLDDHTGACADRAYGGTRRRPM